MQYLRQFIRHLRQNFIFTPSERKGTITLGIIGCIMCIVIFVMNFIEIDPITNDSTLQRAVEEFEVKNELSPNQEEENLFDSTENFPKAWQTKELTEERLVLTPFDPNKRCV